MVGEYMKVKKKKEIMSSLYDLQHHGGWNTRRSQALILVLCVLPSSQVKW